MRFFVRFNHFLISDTESTLMLIIGRFANSKDHPSPWDATLKAIIQINNLNFLHDNFVFHGISIVT